MAYILMIKDENGEWHSIPALKGDSPKLGVDYFTEEDKAEIRAYIDGAVRARLNDSQKETEGTA